MAALNALFERVVPIIHDHGGRVDKFIGDGLLAVFGAPRRQEDHADQALAAALEIAEEAGGEDQLSFGIGLNSGEVVAGNLGGAGRLEFSVIGDPVNVAARVESATRETGDTILMTERTRELLQRPADRARRARGDHAQGQAGAGQGVRAAAVSGASVISRNRPVTTKMTCSAMSTVLSPIRSRHRATRIISIAHSRSSGSSPISTARRKISRLSRLISRS